MRMLNKALPQKTQKVLKKSAVELSKSNKKAENCKLKSIKAGTDNPVYLPATFRRQIVTAFASQGSPSLPTLRLTQTCI